MLRYSTVLEKVCDKRTFLHAMAFFGLMILSHVSSNRYPRWITSGIRKYARFRTFGAANVFLETGRKDYHMFSPEERQRAVDLYFTTPMTTAQVVEYLGYPTRQCLERWLAKDPRYAGHMAKPIIPLETRTKAIELVLGGMRGSRQPDGSA